MTEMEMRFDTGEFDLEEQKNLLMYFFLTSYEERQKHFLVYSPKALRFWVVPRKENREDNAKMFENGISLRKYLEEHGNE